MTARVPSQVAAPAARRLVTSSTFLTIAFAVVVTIMMLDSSMSWAQTNPLPLGTVALSNPLSSCPVGLHGSIPLSQATCYTATVSNCSSHQTGVTIPEIEATVAVSQPSPWNGGTIFMHGGGTGEDYFDATDNGQGMSYAEEYYGNGFQVVQIAWSSNWSANANAPAVNAMKYVACRPATLLNFTYSHFNGGTGAMCAQGHSAGSAAMAYSLAWYGAGSYLNDVVLSSGPVYANIEAGCQYPATLFPNPITVCPKGQHGCIGDSWTDPVQYLTTDGTAQAVATVTNTPPGNCNNYTGNSMNKTTSYDQNWHVMSVVSSGASYSYPSTSLYAFLCATGQSQNNSAAEGQLFYANFTSASQTLNYNLFRVNGCGGDEEIWDGTTSNGDSAFTDSANAMIKGCVKMAGAQDRRVPEVRDIARP